MSLTTAVLPNSISAISERKSAGGISWPRTLGMLASRTVLFASWQAVITILFALQGQPNPWEASIAWWPVTVVLGNLTSLYLLVWAGKKEGLHLIDFYRVEKHSFWRELPLFLLLTLLAGPIAILPNAIFGNLFFGDAALTAEMMWQALMFLPFALYIGAILNWRPRLLLYFMVVHGLLDASLFLFLLPAAY